MREPKRQIFDRRVLFDTWRMISQQEARQPEIIGFAHQLLASFLLCRINAWSNPYSSLMWCLEQEIFLDKGLEKFVGRSLQVYFNWPKKMKESTLYMAFSPEKNSILYKVCYQKKSYQGEITEKKYRSLINKLNRQGVLSLREVNFLIEEVLVPRNHLPYFCEVHDPVAINGLSGFFKSHIDAQKEALELLSHLKPFDTLGYDFPTELVLEPLYDEKSEIEQLISRYQPAIRINKKWS